MGRRLAIRIGASAMRRGVGTYELQSALARAFKHRPQEWHDALARDIIRRYHASVGAGRP